LYCKKSTLLEKELTALDDTTFSNKLDRYQRIVEEEGFKKVMELAIPSTEQCGSIHDGDKFFVYYHPDGMLLRFDTYGVGINSSTLLFNLYCEDVDAMSKARCDLKCSSYPIDKLNFSGDFDGREALRFHIRELRNHGTLLNPWLEQPFIWLLHWADTKDGYDYEAINKERLAMLPEEVQKMVGI